MVRLLSYNLRSLRDDVDAVVRVIRAQEPDLLCLQEVPRFLGWRKARDALAEAVGMKVLSSRRACGIAVLGKPDVRLLEAHYHLLSWVPGLHRRALAVAVVEVSGLTLTVGSTHLDLVPGPRLRHAQEICRLLSAYEPPAVLAGDFNGKPGGDTWNLLSGKFQDAYAAAPEGEQLTFPAGNPRWQIDGVFVDRRLRVVGCGVPPDPGGDFPKATDHRPLAARIDHGLTE